MSEGDHALGRCRSFPVGRWIAGSAVDGTYRDHRRPSPSAVNKHCRSGRIVGNPWSTWMSAVPAWVCGRLTSPEVRRGAAWRGVARRGARRGSGGVAAARVAAADRRGVFIVGLGRGLVPLDHAAGARQCGPGAADLARCPTYPGLSWCSVPVQACLDVSGLPGAWRVTRNIGSSSRQARAVSAGRQRGPPGAGRDRRSAPGGHVPASVAPDNPDMSGGDRVAGGSLPH